MHMLGSHLSQQLEGKLQNYCTVYFFFYVCINVYALIAQRCFIYTRFKDRVFPTSHHAKKLLAKFAKASADNSMDPNMFEEMLLELRKCDQSNLSSFLGKSIRYSLLFVYEYVSA